MARINPSIALSSRPVNPLTEFLGGQDRAIQRRATEAGTARTEAQTGLVDAQMQEIADARAREAEDEQLFQSIMAMVDTVEPLLDNPEEAARALDSRSRMLRAEGIDSRETDIMAQAVRSGNMDFVRNEIAEMREIERQRKFRRFGATPPSGSEQFTLSPGQARFDAAGNPVAQVAPEADPFTLSEGQTRFDSQGNPIASVAVSPLKAEERLTKERMENLKTEAGLRKEFNNLTKDFRQVSDAFSRVSASAIDPSPAGDLALIFNYMKMLDPGSTVREGEFANAQNSGGVDDRTRALYNSIVEGTRLSESQRGDFMSKAGSLFNAALEDAQRTATEYSRLATEAGVDQRNVTGLVSGREPATTPPNAPQAALDFLRANPETIDQFEQKYGFRPEGF